MLRPQQKITQAALELSIMPTVLNKSGFSVRIYTNDHRPAHVHVIKNGCEAVFNLNCPDGPPELRENYGFSLQDCRDILRLLMANLAALCAAWSQIHGPT